MDIRSALIQRVTARFMRFRATFERFDDRTAEAEKVGPNWNVRDLAGHLAFRTAQTAKRLAQKAAVPTPNPRDVDQANEEVYIKNRRMSFVMLLPQLRAAEEKLLSALQSVPNESLLVDSPHRDLIDQGIIAHYDHHWPGLQSAASRITPP
jgi:Protein of unknown function (DUF1706)